MSVWHKVSIRCRGTGCVYEGRAVAAGMEAAVRRIVWVRSRGAGDKGQGILLTSRAAMHLAYTWPRTPGHAHPAMHLPPHPTMLTPTLVGQHLLCHFFGRGAWQRHRLSCGLLRGRWRVWLLCELPLLARLHPQEFRKVDGAIAVLVSRTEEGPQLC